MDITNMTIEEVWQQISLRTTEELPEAATNLNATYTFHIDDGEEKSFSLIFQDGSAKVEEGTIEDANCQLSMNETNFKKLLTGELNATNAFMTRRLKLKGNIGDALKLEQILKQYSF